MCVSVTHPIVITVDEVYEDVRSRYDRVAGYTIAPSLQLFSTLLHKVFSITTYVCTKTYKCAISALKILTKNVFAMTYFQVVSIK